MTVDSAERPILRFRAARVVMALLLREMTTSYGRNPGGYLWAFVQPLAMIALLSIGFSFMLKAPSLGTGFLLFYATGFLPLRLFQEVCTAVGGAIQYNRSLLAYPRVTYVDVLAARAILSTITQIMVTMIVIIAVYLYEQPRLILRPAPILQAYGALVSLAIGVGCLNAYLTTSFPVWRTVWGILTRPLVLVSCVFYLFEDLPRTAQNVLWFNPLVHISGLVRQGVFATYEPSYVSLIYVYLTALVPMLFGLLILRRFSRDILYK